MSMPLTLKFPDLLYLEDYHGDFQKYFEAVYKVFESHFIHSKPLFLGNKVVAKKYPLEEGKYHRTFYHITHEGDDEHNRLPDLNRMKRIRFPKFVIESCPHPELLIWKNTRGRDTRVLIFNAEENYLVVLTVRKGVHLLCTAYLVNRNHTRQKLMEEYEAYKKTNTA